MKSMWVAALSVILTMGLLIGTAEAKRMGSGSSFGSKPSQSQPMNRDSATNSATPNAAPNSAAAPAAAGSAMPRPGMGGMLGGLLMGGLLGALFFGGAFDNIGLMDIVIFGLIAFLAYKFFASRRASRPAGAAAAAGMGMGAPVPEHAADNAYQRAAANVAPHSPVYGGGGSASMGAARSAMVMPAGFKADEFLTGARRSYERLQQAWDKGELADIRELTTDKVFAEIQDQYRARQGENRTELKDVRAELLDIKEVDGQLEASVMFDTDMIEHDANAPLLPESARVQEVWHFVRPKSSLRPTWFVDGIQQVTG